MTESEASAPDRLLRIALRANAAFSLLSGGFMLVADGLVAAILGAYTALSAIHFVGANLVVFAAMLLWLASREQISPTLALAVVAADGLWVIGSWIAMAAGMVTGQAWWAVGVVANVILLFAVVQYLGVRRLQQADPTAA
jgi:hypothetical protein